MALLCDNLLFLQGVNVIFVISIFVLLYFSLCSKALYIDNYGFHLRIPKGLEQGSEVEKITAAHFFFES